MKNKRYIYNKEIANNILESLNEGIWIVNQELTVVYYNSACRSMLGLDEDEIIGKCIYEVFPALKPEQCNLMKVLQTGKPILNDFQWHITFKGEKKSVSTSAIPIFNNGRPVAAYEVFRDLSELVKLSDKIALQEIQLHGKKTSQTNQPKSTTYCLDDIIGTSNKIVTLKKFIKKIAKSSSSVLIYGETGTGKELVAQAIVNESNRSKKPFVAQNCAAFPENLLEGILFGTAKGSFTGALDKQGLFEIANEGTLFLDEINSMPIELQSKMLRVIQEGKVRRIGGNKETSVDVRIISSTNINPEEAVEQGMLRNDLYYRLNVIYIIIPPLRERRRDIIELSDYFISVYNKELGKYVKCLSKDVLDFFLCYKWPGNVRELKHAIEAAINVCDGEEIMVFDLPANLRKNIYSPKKNEGLFKSSIDPLLNEKFSYDNFIDEVDRYLIVSALDYCNGNITRASNLLKMPRQTLYNKMKNLDIKKTFCVSNER